MNKCSSSYWSRSYCNRYHIGNVRHSQSFCLVGGRGNLGENALASGHASATALLCFADSSRRSLAAQSGQRWPSYFNIKGQSAGASNALDLAGCWRGRAGVGCGRCNAFFRPINSTAQHPTIQFVDEPSVAKKLRTSWVLMSILPIRTRLWGPSAAETMVPVSPGLAGCSATVNRLGFR